MIEKTRNREKKTTGKSLKGAKKEFSRPTTRRKDKKEGYRRTGKREGKANRGVQEWRTAGEWERQEAGTPDVSKERMWDISEKRKGVTQPHTV